MSGMVLKRVHITTENPVVLRAGDGPVEVAGDSTLEMTILFPGLSHDTASAIADAMVRAARGKLADRDSLPRPAP